MVLSYDRLLPSEPKNVSVTAPPSEDGTLEVSWDERDDEGTFPIECYLVEFRHPSGEAKEKKAVLSRLPRPRKGMRRQPADQCDAHGPRNGRPNTRSWCRR